MIPKNYNTYIADDFILDENFREMVRRDDSDNQLKDFRESLPDKKEEINLAIQILKGFNTKKYEQPSNRKQELWQEILHKQKKSVSLSYFRYAATFLLLVGLGSAIYYLIGTKQTENTIVLNETTSNDALLILSHGKIVSINNSQSTIHVSSDGSSIMVNDSIDLTQPIIESGFNQMIVPFGKQSFIVLSEGTKVWLNSGSKLFFPPSFKGKTREVLLEGEAFFDVSTNLEKPFYVKTESFETKVYGTRFNVQAYKQDDNFQVVLVEGKISMNVNSRSLNNEVFLAPYQKASIIKGDDKIEITNVENIDIYTTWINGYLTFSNEDISNILKKVSRYYNVDIKIENPDKIERVYGKLDLKDSIERVLDVVAYISKTTYKKVGNKYVFAE